MADSEEDTFVPEDVSNIIKESIDGVLQDATYTHSKVSQWNNAIVETCLRKLTSMNKPFKYIATERSFSMSAYNSHLHHHAKERRWFTHCYFLLLGQLYRWQSNCEVGKQDNVLHHNCNWFGHVDQACRRERFRRCWDSASWYTFCCFPTYRTMEEKSFALHFDGTTCGQ